MSQQLTLKIRGLYTHQNDLNAPDGGLSIADDIVIDREDLAAPRRGFDRLAAGWATTSHRTNKLFFFDDKILAHYSTNKLAYYDSSTWTDYSTTHSKPESNTPIRSTLANQNLYFTTSTGIYKLDAYNSTPVRAGAYKALDIAATINTGASSTWLATQYATAYRMLWGYKDANNNLILGAPSQRIEVTNATGSAAGVDLDITIPSGVTTDWFFQVYRAASVDSDDGAVSPSDEMGLVYEANPSSAEITAGTISFTDITPDALRGATLYTSATQEGIAQANERPPMAYDIATFKNHTFYANCTSPHRFYLTMLSAGSPNGVQVDDTITIDGVAYTAKAAEAAASAQFRVYTSGSFTFGTSDVSAANDTITETAHPLEDGDAVTFTTSAADLPAPLVAGTTYYVRDATADTFKVSESLGGDAVPITDAGTGTHTCSYGASSATNIRKTSLSLVRVINQHSSSTVYAYYLSGPDDLPGKMLLEERSIGGSAYNVQASRAASWSELSADATNVASENDRFQNIIFFSKTNQPEAVPLVNFAFVGSANYAIKRILPLRDSLFILKEDGIYRLSGSDAFNFRVDLLDSTTRILAPETAQVLNNQVFCLSDQGVVAIAEGGVQVKSRSIENTLIELQGVSLANLKNLSFAVSYESERKYVLFTITEAADTTPTQAFVYNTFTNTWVRWVLSKTCGGVNPADDKLYLGDADSNFVNQERKAFTFTDHADYKISATISAVDSTTLTISNTNNISVGDVIYEDSSTYSTVASVDTTAGTVTTDSDPGFTATTVTVYSSIPAKIAWVPITGGNPGAQKQFQEVQVMFRTDFAGNGTLVFSTDQYPAEETETLVGTDNGGWGLFAWGGIPWGGERVRRPFRVYVPRNKQRANQLIIEFRHSVGFSAWALSGVSVVFKQMSERLSNGSLAAIA